ncbi:PREDICTED: neuropeptide-like protein C4orf48 homolog, partial [Dipodomys ordii]|uniref:NELL2-interacting cell ontogeny regulator 1 n=1 Tax=Dipodomys ordii TaxID=10020 RepID=A0A1S3FTP9_DIPOR
VSGLSCLDWLRTAVPRSQPSERLGRQARATGSGPSDRGGRLQVDQTDGRPCVDCHAFEFMQRALQDLRKTAYSLDARTETLLLQAERRALCACWPAGR